MYAEFNDSVNPNKDWELSVEFYSNEQAEYEFYIASQGPLQVRQEGPQQLQESPSRRKAKGTSKHVYQRVLRSSCY